MLEIKVKCPKCQIENRDGMKFCDECGRKLEIICPYSAASVIHLGIQILWGVWLQLNPSLKDQSKRTFL